ncbi:unnamed protein product [Protopolystoma xenopodis]|uniref:Uncharacterized protein n=1 Tax=Protopolystoma xenopodis TaxID=117903 RepID=A0A3S5CCK6_9PLAT|nr:unnamed protein product [Protopolystoma xenopodis]
MTTSKPAQVVDSGAFVFICFVGTGASTTSRSKSLTGKSVQKTETLCECLRTSQEKMETGSILFEEEGNLASVQLSSSRLYSSSLQTFFTSGTFARMHL